MSMVDTYLREIDAVLNGAETLTAPHDQPRDSVPSAAGELAVGAANEAHGTPSIIVLPATILNQA